MVTRLGGGRRRRLENRAAAEAKTRMRGHARDPARDRVGREVSPTNHGDADFVVLRVSEQLTEE